MLVIPAIIRVKMGGSEFEANPGKILERPHLNKQLDVVVHICNLNYSGGRGSWIIL
jgi:hypothetical protein